MGFVFRLICKKKDPFFSLCTPQKPQLLLPLEAWMRELEGFWYGAVSDNCAPIDSMASCLGSHTKDEVLTLPVWHCGTAATKSR